MKTKLRLPAEALAFARDLMRSGRAFSKSFHDRDEASLTRPSATLSRRERGTDENIFASDLIRLIL
jgi:hypothetical protein